MIILSLGTLFTTRNIQTSPQADSAVVAAVRFLVFFYQGTRQADLKSERFPAELLKLNSQLYLH